MKTIIVKLLHALLYDELAVRRWVRGGCIALAVGGPTLINQMSDLLGGSTKLLQALKGLTILCGFVGGAITAGERNVRPEEQPQSGQTK